jgi:hypothetical protein
MFYFNSLPMLLAVGTDGNNERSPSGQSATTHKPKTRKGTKRLVPKKK